MAVADRVSVLRLGRNNGTFRVAETSTEQVISAITGATSNAVTERAARSLSTQSRGREQQR